MGVKVHQWIDKSLPFQRLKGRGELLSITGKLLDPENETLLGWGVIKAAVVKDGDWVIAERAENTIGRESSLM